MSAQMHSKTSFLCERAQDSGTANPEFESLLSYLKHHQGCDFTNYKRSSLMRRFQFRMQTLSIQTYQHYLEYLQLHPNESRALINDVLINFTSFFRDHSAWTYLAAEIIPRIIASKQLNEPIRIWSAGCAAGQEVYTLLILFAEALGLEDCLQRVRCFGTDADESALVQARSATYSSQEVSDIPPHLLQKYFEQTEKGYLFKPMLRSVVVFSRHDLMQDPPISKIDLLVCRNVLIYFNSDAQAAILSRLHFALSPTGFLFLGKAEMLLTRRPIFAPVDLQCRIYTKSQKLNLNDYLLIRPQSAIRQVANSLPLPNYFWESAFEASASAHLAIDTNGCLLYANQQARTAFGLTSNDWQCPFAELELAKLIGFSEVMRALHSEQRLTRLKNIKWTTEADTKYFDVEIVRVLSPKNHLLGVTLTLIEVDIATATETTAKTATKTNAEPKPEATTATVAADVADQDSQSRRLRAELEIAHSELAKLSQLLAETQSELKLDYEGLDSSRKELELLHQAIQDGVK